VNLKWACSLILTVIGVVLLVFGIHAMHHATEAKGFYNNVNNFFTHNPMWNPLIEFFGGKPQQKTFEHSRSGLGLLIAGIVFVIAGFVTVIFGRKKKP
jgi:hypothetical protein